MFKERYLIRRDIKFYKKAKRNLKKASGMVLGINMLLDYYDYKIKKLENKLAGKVKKRRAKG